MKRTIRLTETELSFLIKKIIEEQTENEVSKTNEISLIQTELDKEGIKIDAEKNLANSEDPLCSCPKTGDSEKDGILQKIFDWAKTQPIQNLKKEIRKIRDKRRELKRLKKQGKLQEQVFEGIMIGTFFLSTSMLLAIGGLIIITIIIIVLLKNGKSGHRCGNPFDRL